MENVKIKKTLVLGLGNDILTDDGIGPMLVSDLTRMAAGADIQFETMACGGLEVMEYIKGYRKVIFIDAIRTRDGNPGDVHYFRLSEFTETLNLSSLHDVDFLTALKLGKALGMNLPADLHIIAVEIVEDREFSEELSPLLNERYPAILEEVSALIGKLLNS